MLFSYEWLSQYVGLGEDVESVARGLTDVGLAVELIEEVDGDRVLDLDITTNRPDCMNHLGVAREAAAVLGKALRPPVVALGNAGPPPNAEGGGDLITIEEPDLCRRFVGIVVEGVTIKDSPEWLQRRLEAIGLRPINNVVDITNFVLWELGQPLHAYDLDTLDGGRIVVRRAQPGETLATLDGETRELQEQMVVIADGRRGIGLGGVMGGADTEVRTSTRRILIEGAWFDPQMIRRTTKTLGMHTDASHRFERTADIEGCRAGVERAAALVLELAGGQLVGGTADISGIGFEPTAPISLSHNRLERFAGTAIPNREVSDRLRALGFELQTAPGGWLVTPPPWRRFDVLEAADLYEEVLRSIGFSRIPSALPPSEGPDAPETPLHALRRQLRHQLAGVGFAEVINYAFYGSAEDQLVQPLVGDHPAVELENPLSDLYRWMRRSLVPGVVENARFNRRRNLPSVRLFEVGHVFWSDESGEPAEREHVAIVLGGRLGSPWEREVDLDLFDLKGVVEVLTEGLGVSLSARPATYPGLLPGVAAELLFLDQVVGFVGELDEDSTEVYPLYVAELDLGCLLPLPDPKPVRVPSKLPGIAVDLTLTHPTSVAYDEIAETIESHRSSELAGFGLKGRYEGKGVPTGSVNTTIHFLYNAEDRTLTQEEVNECHQRLSNLLTNQFGSRSEES